MVKKNAPRPAPELADAPREIRDISARLPGYEFRTILAVGAGPSQSCLPLADALPGARIHAFEPAARSFAALLASVEGRASIEAVNLALGAAAGRGASPMPKGPAERPTLAQALGRAPGGVPQAFAVPEPRRAARQEAEIVTGADFCRDRGIDHISFLKIAAEGHDLAVIKGFGPSLQAIDFVQVEAGTNEHNQTHAPLRDFQAVLGHAGFYLFRIYGEAFEFKGGGRPVSRRCNPLFINRRLVGDMAGID
jgi:FkbM family methyltransferase